MRLLVGCPIRGRQWALQRWFAGVETAASLYGVEPEYAFVADPRDPTVHDIERIADRLHRPVYFSWVEENDGFDVPRFRWTEDRIHRMVYLRNLLLERVRQLQPDLFLSLDSDIFLHPLALDRMSAGLTIFGAIGGKTFMQAVGYESPSFAFLSAGDGLYRYNAEGFFAVDVIMAIKLMQPQAYRVDYEWHHHGEDIGWSKAVRGRQIALGWDGSVCSKHVISEELAEKVDVRCGY